MHQKAAMYSFLYETDADCFGRFVLLSLTLHKAVES